MNYNINENEMQLSFGNFTNYLKIPSNLESFNNTETTTGVSHSGRNVFCFNGNISINDKDRYCSECGSIMHINGYTKTTLRHLCFGSNLTCLNFLNPQFYCPNCGSTKMNTISFKADNHRITKELLTYTKDLLATAKYTNKEIDLKRLKDKYIENGKLTKPTKTARYLGIDEFKLHDGHKYATHIIDMETGHILFIAHGKRKQVVYDFIEYVGLEWMDNVEAVACDMNSDFEEAFVEKCPHIQPVFDYFHIVKNFNEKVVDEVRKDEEKRLREEGNIDAAKRLKRTKYILTSSRETLKQKMKKQEKIKLFLKVVLYLIYLK